MAARKVLKWIGVGIGAVLSLALLAVAVVYVVIGSDLSATFDVPASDVGSIIGFLQSQVPRSDQLPKTRFGPIGRLLLLLFKQETGTILAAESIRHDQARLDASPGDSGA